MTHGVCVAGELLLRLLAAEEHGPAQRAHCQSAAAVIGGLHEGYLEGRYVIPDAAPIVVRVPTSGDS